MVPRSCWYLNQILLIECQILNFNCARIVMAFCFFHYIKSYSKTMCALPLKYLRPFFWENSISINFPPSSVGNQMLSAPMDSGPKAAGYWKKISDLKKTKEASCVQLFLILFSQRGRLCFMDEITLWNMINEIIWIRLRKDEVRKTAYWQACDKFCKCMTHENPTHISGW